MSLPLNEVLTSTIVEDLNPYETKKFVKNYIANQSLKGFMR